jgi:D-alanine-D-alanine ligase-like ATP-grasp enzyme
MANQKLSQEELQRIEEIQNRMQAVKTELGQLALAEIDLKNRRVNVENYLTQTQELETSLVKELEEKYGKGSIDLQNGEFIPFKQKQKKKLYQRLNKLK